MSEHPLQALRRFAMRAHAWGLAPERVDELLRLITAIEKDWPAEFEPPPDDSSLPPHPPATDDPSSPAEAETMLETDDPPDMSEPEPVLDAEEDDEFEQVDTHTRLLQVERGLLDFSREFQVAQRVLLADDDPDSQAELIETLAQNEILADAASTGEEVLERLAERTYAVLVADARLPDMDTADLVSQALKTRPGLEVVVCTRSDALDEALIAFEHGASDYLPKPYPSRPFTSWKIRAALTRHEFEARSQAIIQYLSRSCENLATERGHDLQQSCIIPLKQALEAYRKDPGPTRMAVLAPVALERIVQGLGFETTHCNGLSEVMDLVKAGSVEVVVAVEEGGLDGIELISRVRRRDPQVGLFIVAQERKLEALVKAIDTSVGDCLLRPLEGRELLAPRLKRLISRQQKSARYERLLAELKALNIDLLKAALPER